MRAFRLLWLGQTVSFAGDALVAVALVFAILRSGGTASDIGYVIAGQALIRVALVLAGGVWADRLPRQLVMLGSDLVRLAVQAALAALLLAGRAQVWELGLGAAVFGAAQSFFGPASTGLLPQLVPPAQLQRANALMGFSRGLVSVAGPAAAALLIAAFGPGLAFAVDAATFAVSAVCLALLRLPASGRSERAPFLADLAAGWREVAIRPWYWLGLSAHALWNLAIPAYLVLGPVIALRALGGASAWGAMCSSWAVGAIVGGLVALRVRPRRPLVAGNLALLLGTLPLLALARPLPVWAIGIAASLASAAVVFMNTVWTATMQRLIPAPVRSRVDSYDWLISLVVMPAGFAVVGPLAATVGPAATLTGAALVLGIPGAIVALLPAVRAVQIGGHSEDRDPDRGGGARPARLG